MKYRKLRIAWSAGCGTICLLLIVLWVRSYWWCDVTVMSLSRSQCISLASKDGDVGCALCPTSKAEWKIYSIGMDEIRIRTGWNPQGFYWSWQVGPMVQVRHWFAVCVVVAFAALPWIRLRFSLRTLLIGMTLVAVVLGLIVAFGR
jgi:hypothetical protein